MENTGFIEVLPTPTDYISGVNSPIEYEVLEMDWSQYLPDEERQHSVYFDTMACVSFSAHNVLETQLNRMLALGELIPDDFLSQYIVNGKFNLCDRFLAKVSGTTRQGNYIQKVCDTLRHFGAIPEPAWGYPVTQRTPVFDWDDYYAEIPQELLDMGKRFTEYFDISYEWVFSDHLQHLLHAPLQVTIPTCSPYVANLLACGLTKGTHAVEMYREREIFDQYDPFIKTLSSDYPVPWKMKIIIKQKNRMYPLIRKQGDEDVYYLEEVTDAEGNKTTGRVHIGDGDTFRMYEGKMWGSMADVKELTQAEFDAIKKTGVILRTFSE